MATVDFCSSYFCFSSIYKTVCNKKLKVGKNQTNVNVLEGQDVLVIKPISKFQKGEVKATNGVVWAAKAQDEAEIEQGAVCHVVAVEGNTLTVSK